MHLLTLEAFATYRRASGADGLLMVHISNRYLDLEPVIAAAAAHGWTRASAYSSRAGEERARNSRRPCGSPCRRRSDDRPLARAAPVRRDRGSRSTDGPASSAWTDEHATILPIITCARRQRPMIAATTDRLILRDWGEGDADRFYAMMNTPAVMRWLGGVQTREEWLRGYDRITGYRARLRPHLVDRRAQGRRRDCSASAGSSGSTRRARRAPAISRSAGACARMPGGRAMPRRRRSPASTSPSAASPRRTSSR